MTEDLITQETAELAKSKGFELTQRIITVSPFPVESHGSEWDERGITPSLLQKWLREKHSVNVSVIYSPHELKYEFYIHYSISDERITQESPWFNTYKVAFESGLQAALKLI